ncbi:SHOCT domain-containing protein [Caldisericum sp.]|uniref:SHOCT domain-containing protein n=1 Tax=Caldisericum sp. TaxID=2499687 RepID=UPI003D0C7C74
MILLRIKKISKVIKIIPIFLTLILISSLFIPSLSAGSNSVLLSGATITNGQTSINLPSGSQVYIYGVVTGGQYYLSTLKNHEINFDYVTDYNSKTAAELAMTSSNSNSFTTQCSDYSLGGVGVSGYSTFDVVYGSNGNYGASGASVTFTLKNTATVVVFALASGGQTHVTLSGIPGFKIISSNENGLEGFLIGMANLSPGQYTAVETSSPSSSNPGNQADLIGVYEFFGSQSSGSSVPVWAFNGAYADYLIKMSYNGVSMSIPVYYNISNVNTATGTFYVSESYGGDFSYLSGGSTATFSSPSPFPAVSQSDLAILKMGKAPSDMPGAQVTTGVSVSVPAGTFNTIQINYDDGVTIYIEMNSGLIVEADGIPGLYGLGQATMVLTKTNIPMGTSIWTIVIIVIIVAVIALIAVFIIMKRKTGPKVSKETGINDNSIEKLIKLKDLLDKGLITKEEFEAEKARLTKELTPTGDVEEKLNKLKALLDSGAITQNEYEEQKQAILEKRL